MTNEEASILINTAKAIVVRNTDCCEKVLEALDMAISTLSTEGEYIKKEDTIEYLNDLFGEMCHVSFGNVLQSIDSLPTYSFPNSAEIKGFDGMTNGEVIQALFPNANYESRKHFMHITHEDIGGISFFWEWWNAPYKAESEDKAE